MEIDSKERIENSNILLISGEGENLSLIDSYKEISSRKLGYFMWLSRLCILIASCFLAFMVMSSLVLFKMGPSVIVEPLLIIEQDSSDGVVRNEPIDFNMATKDQLMETFIKQYVYYRNIVINDEREMQTRWQPGGILHLLSVPGVFNDFSRYRDEIWNDLTKSSLVREVEIISVKRVGGEKSAVWNVEFRTYDLYNESRNNESRAIEVTTRYWTTSMTAYFVPERVFLGVRLLNPLGFTVFRYSQREVEGLSRG